jgi:hypothetical protein
MMGLLAFLALAVPPTVRDCGVGKSVFKIHSVSITPSDPSPGDKVALNLDYTVPNGVVITSGQTKYDVTYNFLPVYPTIEPLCQNIPCPLGPGRYKNSSTSTWPTGLTGSVAIQLTWTNEVGTQLLCINVAGNF